MRWLAPQVVPSQPLRVTMPWMPISGANGPGLKSEPAAAWTPASSSERIRHAALHQLLAVVHELVGVVVGVGREHRRHGADRLDAPHEVVVDERAVRDLRPRVGAGQQLLRALHGGEIHVDGHVAVGVAVHLDAGAVHALDPLVQRVLRLGDVALVGRRDAGIRRAQRHRALRERAVHGVLGRGAELDPLVAEAGLDAGGDHRLEHARRSSRS